MMTLRERIQQIVKTHTEEHFIIVMDSEDGDLYEWGTYLSDLQGGLINLGDKLLDNELGGERTYVKDGVKVINLEYKVEV